MADYSALSSLAHRAKGWQKFLLAATVSLPTLVSGVNAQAQNGRLEDLGTKVGGAAGAVLGNGRYNERVRESESHNTGGRSTTRGSNGSQTTYENHRSSKSRDYRVVDDITKGRIIGQGAGALGDAILEKQQQNGVSTPGIGGGVVYPGGVAGGSVSHGVLIRGGRQNNIISYEQRMHLMSQGYSLYSVPIGIGNNLAFVHPNGNVIGCYTANGGTTFLPQLDPRKNDAIKNALSNGRGKLLQSGAVLTTQNQEIGAIQQSSTAGQSQPSSAGVVASGKEYAPQFPSMQTMLETGRIEYVNVDGEMLIAHKVQVAGVTKTAFADRDGYLATGEKDRAAEKLYAGGNFHVLDKSTPVKQPQQQAAPVPAPSTSSPKVDPAPAAPTPGQQQASAKFAQALKGSQILSSGPAFAALAANTK